MQRGAVAPRILGVAVLTLLLAGCAGARARPLEPDPLAQPVGFTDETASVRGYVVDDEFVPLPNAIVGFIDPYQATRTDAEGRFEIGQLERVGERNLYVIHLGHKSDGKRITLTAGQATEVTFILPLLPVEGPWTHIVHKVGNFTNAVRVTPGPTTQSHEAQWRLADKLGALEALQMDARWTQTSALSGGLRFTLGLGGKATASTFFTAEGRGPLVHAVGREQIEATVATSTTACVKDPCYFRYQALPGTRTTNAAVDFGILPEQRFDVWVSHFYRMEMPPGYQVP